MEEDPWNVIGRAPEVGEPVECLWGENGEYNWLGAVLAQISVEEGQAVVAWDEDGSQSQLPFYMEGIGYMLRPSTKHLAQVEEQDGLTIKEENRLDDPVGIGDPSALGGEDEAAPAGEGTMGEYVKKDYHKMKEAHYPVGAQVLVLRSDESWSPAVVAEVYETAMGPCYDVVLEDGNTKSGVEEGNLSDP